MQTPRARRYAFGLFTTMFAAFFLSVPAFSAQIGLAQQDFFVADSTGVIAVSDNTDPTYTSTLSAANLGTFGWAFTNTGTTTLSNVTLFVFLDADIDRPINGATNEYGQVISQALPPGSAANAINWSTFQIDEPGFVSGTIFNNLLAGFLDNTNHVPPGTTNDVSLALGFTVGTILPGQQSSVVVTMNTSNIGGLSQTDPDSNFTFYMNGYATAPAFGPNGSGNPTPEPSTATLAAIPLLALCLYKRKKLFPVFLTLAAVGLALFAPAADAQMTLSPQATAQGFQLTQFIDGFNSGSIGPLGIAYPVSGGVLVAGYDGTIRLLPSDADGQHAANINPSQSYGFANAVGLTVAGGRVYMTEQSAGTVVQLNDDGTFNQTIATGLGSPTGITTNPANGHIFVSSCCSGQGIWDIDPIAKKVTSFQTGTSPDGLTFAADGSAIYAEINGHIYGYRISDKAQIFDSGGISGADGCALGTGVLSGFVFVNTNYGYVIQVDLATSTQTILASGGSRGDFVTVDPNGSLLLTQSDRVLRLTAPSGGGFGNSTPVISNLTTRFKDASVDVSWAPPALFSNTGTITVCYYCANNLGISPTADGPVFVIQNSATSAITGATLSIVPPSGAMDSFLIGTIGPGSSFVLTPGVSNDHGTGHTFFAVTGSLLDTSDSGPNADTTQFRLIGSEGGNSVDTGIFTPAATRSLSNDGTTTLNFLGNEDGPCNNCFGPKVVATLSLPHAVVSNYNLYRRAAGQSSATRIQSGLTGTFFEDTGLTDGTTYYYTVRWVDPTGVESGDSTEMSATPTSLASRIAHNTPPTILSNPTVLATSGSPYTYQVQASDPDPGDVLTYTLPTAPTGMKITSSSGLISWTPLATQTGKITAKVVVTDKKGHFASQQYQIVVQSAPPTAPPVITSNPVLTGAATQLYAYQVLATDPNTGAVLTYSLTAAPAGMNITQGSGFIQWIPTAAQIGTQNVTVMVQDQFGLSATQSFTITVGAAPIHYPVITSTPVTTASATLPYTYQVTASDPNAGQTLTYSLLAAPAGMTINPTTGQIQWNPTVPQEGTQQVSLQVIDTLQLVASQLFYVQVTAPVLPPTVIITSPTPGSMITSVTNITGSITDPNNGSAGPLTWTLSILKPGFSNYQTIASGSSPITSGTIATIDPTMLPNNSYPVQLTVQVGSYVSTTDLSVNVSGNLKMGNFATQFTDLSIPVAGVPISITRRYDSLDTSKGDFGAGWRLALPGQVTDSAGGMGFTGLTRIYVTLPDGKREGFTFNPTLPSPFFPIWLPGFTPDPGVTDTLSTPSDALFNSSGTFYDLGGLYSPTSFSLTTASGVKYDIDEVAGLQKITDANGNTLTVAPLGLISSTGVSLTFQRDAQNRISKIIEPGSNPGSLQYSYDANGNLSAFTDQSGNVTTYFYENSAFPNYLTKVQDPLGRPVIRTVYDGSGRLIAQCDAHGDVTTLAGCTQFSPNAGAKLQTIVNARGFRTDLLVDASGNILTERHWLDSASYLDTVRTYDIKNNLLTETDPDGNVSTFTYDGSGNLLSYQDPTGRNASYTYNSCNKTLTQTDPAHGVTTYAYDSACNLTQITDPSGRTIKLSYDSTGQLIRMVDAVNNTWTWGYDSNGFATSATDPFGKTTSYTYGPVGEMLSQVDRLNRRIDYTRDSSHRLTKETWDNGRVTTYTYNAAGELMGGADPDSSLAMTYDPTGKVTTVDNAGTPGAPHVALTYAYDGSGNITSVSDSLGGLTTYSYDALDRLSSIVQSGTGALPKRVDLSFNRASALQQISRYSDVAATQPVANTILSYACSNCVGLLTGIHHRKPDNSVIHDLDFTRGSAGGVTGIADADGAHTYTSDSTDQLLTATHQSPSQPAEFYAFDPIGDRLSSHLSQTYTYSWQTQGKGQRLLQTDQSGYSYDDEGNLSRQIDNATGAVTYFTYDYYNRLVQVLKQDAGGNQIGLSTYSYDFDGRRITSKENGVTSYYAYDQTNPFLKFDGNGQLTSRRLYNLGPDQILADESAGQTRWFYADNNGTIRDIGSNNGSSLAHYTYDSFGRLLAQTGSGIQNDLLFTGREFSAATGLTYYRARFYDPKIGRFISEDPFGFSGGDVNLYRYVHNSPLDNVDPTGNDEAIDEGILSRIAAFQEAALECLGQALIADVIQGGVYLLISEATGIYGGGGSNVYAGQTTRQFDLRFQEHLRSGKTFRWNFKFGIPQEVLKKDPKIINTIEKMLMDAFGGKGSLANIRNAPKGPPCP